MRQRLFAQGGFQKLRRIPYAYMLSCSYSPLLFKALQIVSTRLLMARTNEPLHLAGQALRQWTFQFPWLPP